MENEKHIFIKLMTEDLKGKGLSLTDKAVYSSLYSKYQYHNAPFYTYESFIADELEISEKTVMRSITKLQEAGLIKIDRKYNKDTKKTVNFYTVNEPDKAQIQAPRQEIKQETVNVSIERNEALTINIEETKPEPVLTTEKPKLEQPITMAIITHKPTTKPNPEYDKLLSVIKTTYNSTPEEYFSNINNFYDISYNLLEDLSCKAHITPQTVLNYIKEVKHIVA